MTEGGCAVQSERVGEPLAGTAVSGVGRWVVLEYNLPWAAKAFEQSALPPAVHGALRALLAAHPDVRVQLIRRPGRRGEGPPACFLADSAGGAPRLYELALERLEDLAAVDLAAWARGQADLEAHRVTGPLYLVCVHGKRDRCCARLGMPVYEALAARAGTQTWQTTHLGGHRFAATLLTLPHGISYGRVRPEDAEGLVAATARGAFFDLDKVRGRTSLPPEAQAAEVWLRQRTGDRSLRPPALLSCAQVPDGVEVCLGLGDGAAHRVRVGRRALPPIAQSCGNPARAGAALYALP